MLEWFHAHSNMEGGALVLLVGLLVTTVLPYVVRRQFNLNPSEHLAKGAEESFKLFISLTLLLLAFCLVRMQGDHRGTEDIVAREGAVMVKLDRSYEAFGGATGPKMQAAVLQYAKVVVEQEWPVLETGGRDAQADNILTQLGAQSKQLNPETPAQQVARAEAILAFNQMNDLREARLSAARLALPTYYWYAIITSLVFYTFFAWLQSPLPKLLAYVGGVTCGLGLLLTILIATAGIFVGESAVTPDPILKAIPQLARSPEAQAAARTPVFPATPAPASGVAAPAPAAAAPAPAAAATAAPAPAAK